ncbi:MAG TPA: PKD domain-containing protein [Candidatus Thermoplasmatota archaeon]|nr:PKD domain-containing protein [Candidatus Thermoplasmatota archaeon]
MSSHRGSGWRTLVVVGALLAPVLGVLALPGAAASTDPVVNVDTGLGYGTIGAALAAASAGHTLVVRPGEYAEAVTINVPVTLCSTVAAGVSCNGDAASTRIVSSSGTGITVNANGVTIRGFTIHVSGPTGTTVYGIDAPATATRSDLVIRDNVIQPNPAATHSAVPENGIRGRLRDAVIAGNTITHWASAIYFRPYSAGGLVESNRLEAVNTGVLAYGTDHTIRGNTFAGVTGQGVDVAQVPTDAAARSDGIVLRDNALAGATVGVRVRDAVENTVVDARLNNWGVYSCAGIAAKIVNEGPGSSVLFARWNGLSGSEAPVRLAGDAVRGFCNVPEAIAAASPGATILVEPGTYAGALSIGKAVTVCSAAVGADACGGSVATTILDGNGAAGAAITLAADDVTLKGFTVRGANTLVSTTGYDRARIEGNRLQVTPSTLAATHGVRLSFSDSSRVLGNVVTGNDYPGSHAVALFDSADAVVANNDIDRASVGVYLARTTDAFVHDNTLTLAPNGPTGGATLGISVYEGAGAALERNAIDGAGIAFSVNGATDTTSTDDAFSATPVGVRLSASSTTQPSGFILRGAEFENVRTTLEVASGVAGQYVDARYNHWGAYSRPSIEATTVDGGSNNVIDVSCFYERDGTTAICPPLPSFAWTPTTPKIRQAVMFTDASTSGGRPIVSRDWAFSDGATAAGAAVSRTFARSGNVDVTLTIVDGEGYSVSATRTITIVNNAPTLPVVPDRTINERQWIAFWVNGRDVDNDPLTYTIAPKPAGVTFAKGGNQSAFFNWVPANNQAGVYDFVVTVTDGDLAAVGNFRITVLDVNAIPTARFNGVPVVGVGQTAKFTSTSFDPDGTIVQTNWTFSDGPVLAGAVVERSFAAGGVYGFVLAVVDNDGAVATKEGIVQVDATAPVSTIALSGPGNAPNYSGTVTATLAATDSHGGAVKRYARVDGGAPVEVTGPLSVSSNGPHTIEYWAVDARGNVEAPRSVQFLVDLFAPDASWSMPRNLGPFMNNRIDIEVIARDLGSGMKHVKIFVGDLDLGQAELTEGAALFTIAGSGPYFRATWDTTGVAPGLHMLTFVAEDHAGHTTRADRAVLVLPPAPQATIVVPDFGVGDVLP